MAENNPNPSFDDLEDLLVEAEQRRTNFVAAWQDSKTPRLESFLPEGKSRAYEVVLLSLIGIEHRELVRRGRASRLEDWLERFPEFHELICEHWESLATSLKDGNDQFIARRAAGLRDLQQERHALVGYQLREKLGEGQTCHVYRCVQTSSNQNKEREAERPSVFKVLRKEFLQRFSQAERERWISQWIEANQVIQRVAPLGLTAVYDVKHVDESAFVRIEQAEGAAIERLAGAPHDQATLARAMRTIVVALSSVHAAHLSHGALRSSKLMKSELGVMKIGGLGFVKAFEGLPTAWQMNTRGRRNYLAPELFADPNALNPACDIYSLGSVFYQLLSGHPPRGDLDAPSELATFPTNRPVPLRRLNPAVDRALENVLHKCLEASPKRRYTEVGALHSDLMEVIEGPAKQKGAMLSRGGFWGRFFGRPQ
jgi:serine/threonine protein kinase